MANILSAVILGFFFWGRSLRFTNLRRHMHVMTAVLVADLTLVLGLVLMRNALGKVVAGEMSLLLKIHVPIAILTVVLYLFTGWTGYQLYRGKLVHARMRWLDRCLVPARVLTLITSLLVQFFTP